MANVLLTQKCVRSCPYCFAKKHMSDSTPDDVLTWENLIYITDFFEASGEKHISLLGGEPTLHPDFVEFVLYLLERNFHISVFTCGVMSQKKLEEAKKHLENIPHEKLSFIINVNEEKMTSKNELVSVKNFLRSFGHLITPGFNIFHIDFDISFIFRYINEYGLHRHIRLGLAHPIPGINNIHISPDNFGKLADKLFAFYPLFKRLKIKPGFDCGFPLCIFSDDQIGKLYKLSNAPVIFQCGPTIDIGPDLSVWPCFPLSRFHKKSLYDFNSMEEIYQFYHHIHQRVRGEVGGIFPECDECSYRHDNFCSGGCLAHLISAFDKEPRIRFPEVYMAQ